MKITKTVTHHVRMGPYESFVVGTSVEVDSTDDTVDPEKVLDQIDEVIAASLEPDIKAAKALALEDSYIQDWGSK